MKPAIENIRGLNLVAVKLMTVQVTKLLLQHKINKIGMICSAKPGLTAFSITCYMCDMYT
jgi:hypothetical protein